MTPPDENLTDDDLERVSNMDDYDEQLLLKLSEDEWRNLLILDKLDDLIKRGHRRILVFCLSVKHSNILAIFMNMKSDCRCASITSDTPPDMRAHWIESFVDDENDEPCVLFNYGVLTTGFDAPKTSAAIIARPTKSLLLYSQMVGRVIRGDMVGGTEEAEIWTVVDQKLPGFRDMSEAFWNWEDVW
jgi:superfamily II DNA or RNA helicase